MKRLCLVGIGLIGLTVATEAVAQPKPGRAHVAKLAGNSVAPRADPLALSNVFSDPALPRFRPQTSAATQFPPIRTQPLVEPKGGFSIRAGQDNPDEPMTGGLDFRF